MKGASGQNHEVMPETEPYVSLRKNGSRPLSESARSFFESRFSADFSGVRIHSDNASGGLTEAVRARAFTIGSDIFFGRGQYAPGTVEGNSLLAHELTHVVQQTGTQEQSTGLMGCPSARKDSGQDVWLFARRSHDVTACQLDVGPLVQRGPLATLRMQPGGAGGTPIDQFTEAAATGDVVTMDLLVSSGVDINGRDSNGLTALMRAADAGEMRSVKFLIKNNTDLTIVDRDKKTALFHASENDQAEVTTRLLLEGADPNVRADFDRTALMATAEKGHVLATEALIEGGANVNDTEPINGWTALMLAAGNGHADVVSVLVSNGADITKADLSGLTPLMVAAREGIASSLLRGMSMRKKRRIDYINAQDGNGRTALMYAAEKGNKREVELLLRAGADVNIQDNNKRSAIINVAATPQKDIYVKQAVLRALIKAEKVNLNLQDNENKTALMRAVEIGDVETVKTLIYEGAKVDVEFAPGETALTMAKEILRNTSMQEEFTFIIKVLEFLPRKAGPGHK